MTDQYESLAFHLAEQLRRWLPINARVTLHLRGPEIETGGEPNEMAITWEAPPPPPPPPLDPDLIKRYPGP